MARRRGGGKTRCARRSAHSLRPGAAVTTGRKNMDPARPRNEATRDGTCAPCSSLAEAARAGWRVEYMDYDWGLNGK